MTSISIIVPSRARPANCVRLLESLNETITTDNVTVDFRISEEDPYLESYLQMVPQEIWIGPENTLSTCLNSMAVEFAPSTDIIGFIGDDVISRTNGWDEIVLSRFKKNAVMYPNDGHQGEGLPTSVFMDANIIRKVGYMVYPKLTHLYIDNHWRELGLRLGTLDYLADVDMEHMHPYAGKAEMDETYELANSAERYSVDNFWFQHYRDQVLPYDLRKLV